MQIGPVSNKDQRTIGLSCIVYTIGMKFDSQLTMILKK